MFFGCTETIAGEMSAFNAAVEKAADDTRATLAAWERFGHELSLIEIRERMGRNINDERTTRMIVIRE